jgi:hypothetical protein
VAYAKADLCCILVILIVRITERELLFFYFVITILMLKKFHFLFRKGTVIYYMHSFSTKSISCSTRIFKFANIITTQRNDFLYIILKKKL